MGKEGKAAEEDKKEDDLLFLAPPLDILESSPATRPTFWEKFSSNPFIPVGVLATCFALGNGLRHLYKRDTRKQQTMMRLRVGAQGFTVVALIVGVVIAGMKGK